MSRKIHSCAHAGMFISVLITLLLAMGAASPAKKSLTHEVYDSWKSISSADISTDGHWLLYLEVPQDGDAMLVVKNLDDMRELRQSIGYSGEGTEAHKTAKAQFNLTATHAAFLISPSKEAVLKAKKEKKKKDKEATETSLGIMDLKTGKVTVTECVKSFQVPEKNGDWLAYLMGTPPAAENKEEEKKKEEKKAEEKKEEKKESENKDGIKEKERKYGTQLVFQALKEGAKPETFASVLEYRLTKDGQSLFYIVSSKDKPATDGFYLFTIKTNKSSPLLVDKGIYKNLVMDKNETRLAFLTDRDDQKSEEHLFNLYGWKQGETSASLWISHKTTVNFPKGMSVSDKMTPYFSEDGRILLLGIKEIPESKKKGDDHAEEEAQFELWHWDDPYPYPQQKKVAKEYRDNVWESVYDVARKKFTKLADETTPDVQLHRTGNIALANTILPYTKRISYDGSYFDVYIVSSQTGQKTLVKKEVPDAAGLSPEGKYLYWYQDKNWFAYNIAKRTIRNLTEGLGVHFEQEDWDEPAAPASYGTAGWTRGDAALLAYDRYDIWELNPDQSKARMITEGFGRKNSLCFRYIKTNPEEQAIDLQKTLLFSANNDETMATGFYRDRVQGDSIPEKLLFADKNLIFQGKARNADRLIFTRQDFFEYPDLWVTDLLFTNPQRVSDLGKQAAPFIWGKSELRSFFSTDGKPLKGILIKPEDYEPGKKYPLIVYIYETMHRGVHNFRHPAPSHNVNPSLYVSNGYLIWMPDIVYGTGFPGQDALKCVLPGIEMLVREGLVDRARIGIQGHSWGGYQIAYMVTQTNIFAAAEAGAPVSNMVSAYDGIRWESGMVRQFQYEKAQSRIGESIWQAPLRFIENSPIFWADKVQTPLLILHNDNDGAVPWYQGIEYIMALRRLGKTAYMFNYNGEEHGLRKRINQEDYAVRLMQFFDHYLKGAPMPDWMKKGIKAWEKKEKEKE